MPTWFVPPIVVPAALTALMAACALYQAYMRAPAPVKVVVAKVSSTPQSEPQ
jgi:hypothetical protein